MGTVILSKSLLVAYFCVFKWVYSVLDKLWVLLAC